MTDFVQYLISIVSYVYDYLFENTALFNDETARYMSLGFIYLALLIAFAFMFYLVPVLCKWVWGMFHKSTRG